MTDDGTLLSMTNFRVHCLYRYLVLMLKTFFLQAESCIILRPFLHKLTKSELHAVMTGGFATVAGSYIALLVEVGVGIVEPKERHFI